MTDPVLHPVLACQPAPTRSIQELGPVGPSPTSASPPASTWILGARRPHSLDCSSPLSLSPQSRLFRPSVTVNRSTGARPAGQRRVSAFQISQPARNAVLVRCWRGAGLLYMQLSKRMTGVMRAGNVKFCQLTLWTVITYKRRSARIGIQMDARDAAAGWVW